MTQQRNCPVEPDFISSAHLHSVVTMGWLALGLLLSFAMLVPFLSVLVWATTLAVLFSPLQQWLDQRSQYHNCTALLSTLLIGCLIVLPVGWGIQQLSAQFYAGADNLQRWLQSAPWQQALSLPFIHRYAVDMQSYLDFPEVLKSINSWLLATSAGWVKSSALTVVQTGLVFYVLFFLLRDRIWATRALYTLSPLSLGEMQGLLQQLSATIKAVVYGTLGIATIQGFLGGLMFWWLALPTPLLWGVLMTMVSVLPMLGPFIVWIPAALYLCLNGQWQHALLLVVWGMLVVGTIDNWLRPYWVGQQLHLHPLQIFFSIVGGLLLFGSAGLILGPVIVSTTCFLLVWLKSHSH